MGRTAVARPGSVAILGICANGDCDGHWMSDDFGARSGASNDNKHWSVSTLKASGKLGVRRPLRGDEGRYKVQEAASRR